MQSLGEDFSVICPSGQRLYYEVLDPVKKTVEVSIDGASGALIIPSKVTYNGVTYSVICLDSEKYSWMDLSRSVGDCHGLTSLFIPESLTEIRRPWGFDEEFLFESEVDRDEDKSFQNIVVADSNPRYRSIDGILYNHAGDTLLFCPRGRTGDLVIPNGVTTLANGAFWKCIGLTSVTIPKSVISIEDDAFENCERLKELKMPGSVTYIGDNVFSECRSLTNVSIPNGIKFIADGTFYNCSGLTSVSIPDGVTSIGDHAFYGCVNLMDVPIPNSVTSIGGGAFSHCYNLKNLIIPNAVDTLASNLFSHCHNLRNVTLPSDATIIGDEVFSFCHDLTHIDVPNGVTEIGLDAFMYCSELKSVTIPNSVVYIGEEAFWGCGELTRVTVKAEIPPEVVSFTNDAYTTFSVYDTLYVPNESLALYKSEAPWDKFKNIIGLTFADEPCVQSDVPFCVYDGNLQNKGNEQVTIYSATGREMMHSTDSVILLSNLSHGIYVAVSMRGSIKFER